MERKKRAGIIYRIKEGEYKDNFALALNYEQRANIMRDGKLLVHLFHDQFLKSPLYKDKKQVCLQIIALKLYRVGYSD